MAKNNGYDPAIASREKIFTPVTQLDRVSDF